MLEIKKSPGGVRVIPEWAEKALEKRLKQENNGFNSYGEVQQWLSETLGVDAEYHAVYQMTHYRLKAKLKVPRPQNYKQNTKKREAFKDNLADDILPIITIIKLIQINQKDQYAISLKMKVALD